VHRVARAAGPRSSAARAAARGDPRGLIDSFEAVLAGASPDDVVALRNLPSQRARLNAMRYVLHKLPYANKELDRVGPLDPLLVGRANVVYERGEHRSPIL